MSDGPVYAPGLERLLVPLAELWEDPENLRIHGSESTKGQAASLRLFGQNKPVVALPSGKVLAGNGLFRAAKELAWPQLAVVRWKRSEAEAHRFAVADNRTAELSSWHDVLLARAMVDLAADAPALAAEVGFSATEIRTMQRALESDAESQANAPAERLASHLDFRNEADRELFFAFLRHVGRRSPERESHGSRLAAYVESLSQ